MRNIINLCGAFLTPWLSACLCANVCIHCFMYWDWRWTIVQTRHKKVLIFSLVWQLLSFSNHSTSPFPLNLSLISHSHLGLLILIFVPLCLLLLLLFINNCLFPLSPAWLPAPLSCPPLHPQLQLPWPIWLIKTPEVGHCHDHRPFMLHTHIHTVTRHTCRHAQYTPHVHTHTQTRIAWPKTDQTDMQPLIHTSIHCAYTLY